tara:strand:- start:3121 stop:3441 length:321 start_codon:yes stop_codon:yes gene_type:complete
MIDEETKADLSLIANALLGIDKSLKKIVAAFKSLESEDAQFSGLSDTELKNIEKNILETKSTYDETRNEWNEFTKKQDKKAKKSSKTADIIELKKVLKGDDKEDDS